ncbi:MAG: MoxR family ATPase [Bacteroidia bacterium]|nr:MoxR family ATPase [Bacteroidia bacterium]
MDNEITNHEEQESPVLNPAGTISTSVERHGVDLSHIQRSVEAIRNEIHKVVIGQDEMINLLIAGLFTGGHVLLEGVPGIAKTLTVNLVAKALNIDFKRIQFTPDLMPADVTGTSVFNLKNSEFEFKKGPIFSNLVLIDEINRSPAKTQAALFEVMEEVQVTVDGKTMKLAQPFMVIATQNPIEQEGTYKLPEAQQDRFIFKIKMGYPTLEEEIEILKRFENDFRQTVINDVKAVLTADDVEQCRKTVQKVYIKNELIEYIAKIIDHTRNTRDLFLGASPRASLAIMKTSKAIAAIQGRDFVTPDDIQYVAYPVLNHRVVLTPDKEMEGFDVKDILKEIFEKIDVPR